MFIDEDHEAAPTPPVPSPPPPTPPKTERRISPTSKTRRKISLAPQITIKETDRALNGYIREYAITVVDDKDPAIQLQSTRKEVEKHIGNILDEYKGLKFTETLKLTFEKYDGGPRKTETAYFRCTAKTIINKNQIELALLLTRQQILNSAANWMKESGWMVQSVDSHYLDITKYQPLKGGGYIELPKELQNSKKGLINLQMMNECFRWCYIRQLNPQKKDPNE